MVERTCCPAEWWRLAPGHLADVQGLVLVVQVPVALVRHGGDVVHAALLGDQGEQGTVGDPVVVQRVHPLPVALSLGGGVLVVEDQPTAGPSPPLQVEVGVLRSGGVGDCSVDRVQRLVLHLGDCVAVQGADRDIHVVAVGVQS